MIGPGLWGATSPSLSDLEVLPLQGLRVAFDYRHVEHVGIRHVASRFRSIPPFLAISCIFSDTYDHTGGVPCAVLIPPLAIPFVDYDVRR
jgi:hypothetical protein